MHKSLKVFSIASLLTVTACSNPINQITSPSAVTNLNTNLESYRALRQDDFKWNALEAPNTIGFFNPENNEIELIFEMNSADNKETYARFDMTKESKNVVNAWSPESASLTIDKAYCERNLKVQIDVHRKVDGKWIRDYYTSQRYYDVVGPSCNYIPPKEEEPKCIPHEWTPTITKHPHPPVCREVTYTDGCGNKKVEVVCK